MKNKFCNIIGLLVIALFITSCAGESEEPNEFIRVGVFDGYGGAQTCIWESVEACKLDSQMSVRTITTSDIASGVLDSLDAIIIPGGGGSRQYLNLGTENIARIKEFVFNGGGAVGICAGAYLFSNTPDYSCIAINGAQAIDLEHDNRGHGISAFALTQAGKEIFPEYKDIDTLYCMYYEGPVIVEPQNDTIKYVEFATMLSDVHEEGGAPSNMTNNRPFFIGNEYGEGRVFSSIAHPEATPGKMWMIPRMVRWTLAKKYSDKSFIFNKFQNPNIVQDPTLADREILMTVEDLAFESSCFKKLLYGTPQEKIERLNWLGAHFSWDAKRWVQGVLFDSDKDVRVAAAQYIAKAHYLKYKADVASAYKIESDPEAAEKIKQALDYLESIK